MARLSRRQRRREALARGVTRRQILRVRLSGGLVVAAALMRGMRDHGWLAYIVLTIAITAAGIAWGGQISSNTTKVDRNERTLERLVRSHRRALYGSCRRVNTLRRGQNLAAVQRYRDDLTAARLLRQVPAAQREFRARARRIHWTPLTDCRRAVDTPHQFKAPQPRPVWRTPLGRIPR